MGFFSEKECAVCGVKFRGTYVLEGGAPCCFDCVKKAGPHVAAILKTISVEEMKSKVGLDEETLKAKSAIGFSLKHIHGLPIANGASTTICEFDEKFEFKNGGNTFTIAKDKITDISRITDTEIQQQSVSSVGGAVMGGAIFGVLGAAIGGRTKNIKTTTHTIFLVFTYRNKNGEVSYLCFEVYSGNNLQLTTTGNTDVDRLLKNFNPTSTAGTTIEL
jgi:hypothetical protein